MNRRDFLLSTTALAVTAALPATGGEQRLFAHIVAESRNDRLWSDLASEWLVMVEQDPDYGRTILPCNTLDNAADRREFLDPEFAATVKPWTA